MVSIDISEGRLNTKGPVRKPATVEPDQSPPAVGEKFSSATFAAFLAKS